MSRNFTWRVMQIHLSGFQTNLFLSFASVVAVIGLNGCVSAGYQKGDTAAISMQRAAGEVQLEGRAMDQTMAALSDLISQRNGDLKGPYKRYSRSLDRLIVLAQKTENTGREMEQKNAAYLAEWDRQLAAIDYGHIHEISEARRTAVTNNLDAIQRRYQESQAAVQPLISYLLDIHRALSADLTIGGLEALKGVAQNANENVAKVQTALDALTNELTSSSAGMSSVAYQANTTSAGVR